MRIGLAGYYGYGSFCDDLMEVAIKNTFDSIEENKWVHLDTVQDIRSYNGDYSIFDMVILGGGSLLGLGFPRLIRGLQKASCPFHIFGTGFRFMADHQATKFLWNRAKYIAVRGKTSVERLEKYGLDTAKIAVLGDPIFLLEKQDVEKEGYIGGVTRPLNTEKTWTKKAFDFLKDQRGEQVRLFSFCVGQGDLARGRSLGYETSALSMDETHRAVAKSSFWFGNRLHPFSIALINSTPTIGVEIEFRKVEDVCSTLNYPYWIKANTSMETLKKVYLPLTTEWKQINESVQRRIKAVRVDLKRLAEKIMGG